MAPETMGTGRRIALVLGQLMAAKLVAHGNREQRPFTMACISMVCLITLFALIPPIAARLAGAALSGPASGGHYHVQPQWASDVPREWRAIRCMRLLATDGEHYIARAEGKPNVAVFIPRSDVVSLSPCGQDESVAVPGAAGEEDATTG